MEILTAKDIEVELEWLFNQENYDKLNIFEKEEFVNVQDIINEIEKHSNCSKYHQIGKKEFTCLDMILWQLKKEDK